MRQRFSERHGYVPVRQVAQVEAMDLALRTEIWNLIFVLLMRPAVGHNQPTKVNLWLERLYLLHFKAPADEIPDMVYQVMPLLKGMIMDRSEWYEVYDLTEAILEYLDPDIREKFAIGLNNVLARNNAGYRVVGNTIAPVTSANDLAAVEQAFEDASPLPGVSHHLRRAVELLSDRANPDYANSIKESISAVESVCKSIVGKPRADLGNALKTLEGTGIRIHPALEKGWIALYGYTSDSSGIRHAAMEQPELRSEDALYFLVSCSGFVSLLIAKAAQGGIELSKNQ